MSLLSNLAHAVAPIARPLLKSTALRVGAKFLPGIGTALSVGMTAYDIAQKARHANQGSGVAQAGMGGVPAGLPRLARRVIPGVKQVAQRGMAAGRALAARYPRSAALTKAAAEAAGYTVVGGLVVDAMGNTVGHVRRKRINPLNHRALSRAMSRVRSAQNVCHRVEQLTACHPRRKAHHHFQRAKSCR